MGGMNMEDVYMTNRPVYGMLMQPYSEGGKYKTFINVEHVKFLEAAGARVSPIDYRQTKTALFHQLESLNGVYIPGDTVDVLDTQKYMDAVFNIIAWAQKYNTDTYHFPVVAIQYGMAAALSCQTNSAVILEDVSEDIQEVNVEINMVVKPSHSFIYDHMTSQQVDTMYNNITVYNALLKNTKVKRFNEVNQLNKIFVPIASFDQVDTKYEDEYVAVVEGNAFPFFGIAFSIHKVQYNYNPDLDSVLDFSREAVMHALMLSNFFADEARYSSNMFATAALENASLI
jgi:hypothetical protein